MQKAKGSAEIERMTIVRTSLGFVTMCALSAAVSASNGSKTQGEGCMTQSLRSVGQIIAAVSCARPGTRITLGADTRIPLVEIKSGKSLTLGSADPARPARLGGLSLIASDNVTLEYLVFDGAGASPQRYKLLVFRSSNIALNNLTFEGDSQGFRPELDSALMVRMTTGIEVRNLKVRGYRNGLSMLDVRGALVESNLFENLQTDAIRGGGVNDAVIHWNAICSFRPAKGDHPDGIQFWSRNQKEPMRNVKILDNQILMENGSPIQGIFLRATPDMPFTDIEIRGNQVVGGMFNGIAVMTGKNVSIADNSVLPYPSMMSWIRVEACDACRVDGNQAGKFVLKGTPEGPGSRVVKAQANWSEEVRSWRASRPAVPACAAY